MDIICVLGAVGEDLCRVGRTGVVALVVDGGARGVVDVVDIVSDIFGDVVTARGFGGFLCGFRVTHAADRCGGRISTRWIGVPRFLKAELRRAGVG